MGFDEHSSSTVVLSKGNPLHQGLDTHGLSYGSIHSLMQAVIVMIEGRLAPSMLWP